MFCGFNLSYILCLNKQKQTKQNNSFFLTEMRVFLTGKFVFKQTDGQNKAENAGSGGNSSDCQTNGGERALLYQFGVPLACGGLVLYDCYTQVSIASPRVRAGVSKKRDTVFTVP